MAFTHALSTNRYGEADLIVSTSAANGTHTTLAGAMADAVSGQTIFLRDSVTENVTITPGVNIAAWNGSTLNTPTITGTLTMTGAGTSLISGLRLVTNGAAVIAVTGTAASVLRVENCYLSLATTGVSHTSSDASSTLTFRNCVADITTTGVAFFSDSSAGPLRIFYSSITNSGSSVTQNTKSAGSLQIFYSTFNAPITYSSSSVASSIISCGMGNADNVIALTTSGTGTIVINNSSFSSGNTSSLSIGSGTTVNLSNSIVNSTNTNAIDGAGTIIYSQLMYTGTSQKNNVTTQSGGVAVGIIKTTGPNTGFIGEELVSTVSAVAFTSNTAKSITSLSLTPGVWDVTGMISWTPTAGTAVAQAIQVGIGATNNTITGTLGQDYMQFNCAANFGIVTGMVPSLRVSITATTTYYLVGLVVYTSTTCPGNGRFKATRVG